MREQDLRYLACPTCKSDITILEVKKQNSNSIETGILQCSKCNEKYDIVHHIPRFVSSQNYAKSFGLEWTIHARTQYDRYSGVNASESRFFQETKWPRKLTGQVILEIGSGSGRFTEQAAATGAMVVSMDLSCAVEANYAYNGSKDNVLIVQGDIYKMPFKKDFFDKIFCFGMLQHTPNVEKAFMVLPYYLKSGGNLVVDVYAKQSGIRGLFMTKYWIRPITRNLPPGKLYKGCRRYIEFTWPIAKLINKIPYLGKRLTCRFLIFDYSKRFRLTEQKLKEWAILDIFDMLSPRYDSAQSIKTVREWFKNANLHDIDVSHDKGATSIEARGTKP